jgi:hypothetical protein
LIFLDTVRREYLTLAAYFRYYHRSRPRLVFRKQGPVERQVMQDGEIVTFPELGGLHYRYERMAARESNLTYYWRTTRPWRLLL